MTNYTKLSLAEARDDLSQIAEEAQVAFGGLGSRGLNWKPDPDRWSVGQCFAHLLATNQLMLDSATRALSNPPPSIWQRLPIIPSLLGRVMVQSQSPGQKGRYRAHPTARPAESDVPADVIERFARQQVDTARWMSALDPIVAEKAILVSPFVKAITYSVLDGCRLLAAHNRRHFEQARRVTGMPGFPSAG